MGIKKTAGICKRDNLCEEKTADIVACAMPPESRAGGFVFQVISNHGLEQRVIHRPVPFHAQQLLAVRIAGPADIL